MAFAVIETGGKQYRVSPGSFVSVEKLEATEGDNFVFDKVLMYQDGETPVIGAPMVDGAVVTAQIVSQFRGPKIRVSTYKAKKRQRRTLGHRQSLTQVKILEIGPKKPAGTKK
ncbi:MAG: ribosomal protein [Patescibacteria group bacterium]|jgi:large subunit ribosomal protein L21|nr:ribosomal protein [Patescibacteria group bacterium]